MDALEQVRGAIPDAAKDIRLNLQAVLRGGALSEAQRWGVEAAAALMAMNNVYYRFRHMVGKPIYGEKPAGSG